MYECSTQDINGALLFWRDLMRKFLGDKICEIQSYLWMSWSGNFLFALWEREIRTKNTQAKARSQIIFQRYLDRILCTYDPPPSDPHLLLRAFEKLKS